MPRLPRFSATCALQSSSNLQGSRRDNSGSSHNGGSSKDNDGSSGRQAVQPIWVGCHVREQNLLYAAERYLFFMIQHGCLWVVEQHQCLC